MFPDGWENRVLGSRKKRRLVSAKDPAGSPDQPEEGGEDGAPSPHDTDASSLTSSIMQQLHCAGSTPSVPGELDLDYILSRVPYRNILESLMSTT